MTAVAPAVECLRRELIAHATIEELTHTVGGLDKDLNLLLTQDSAGLPTAEAGAGDLQQLLLTYLSDAVRGFVDDLGRIGRADDVAVMVFTEFGRRVRENASRGTDHGTATPMFVIGKPVKGGFYGTFPSLTDLDDGNRDPKPRLPRVRHALRSGQCLQGTAADGGGHHDRRRWQVVED